MAVVVFDLDGTLIHSAPDIHAAAARMLVAEGQDPLPIGTILSYIGNGAPVLVRRIMDHVGLPGSDHDRLLGVFLAEYAASPAGMTTLYPGVSGALAQLRDAGHVLAVCTNKPEVPARDILAALGIAGHFAAVTGGDTLPVRKPDPAPLVHAAAGLGAGPVLFVGDSGVDAETAARARVPFLFFTEGYCHGPKDAIPRAAAFSDFADLPELVAHLI